MKILIRLLKDPFGWFIVFPIIGFLIWGGLNLTGFCWTEKRWLSNEERIDIAIESVIKRPIIWISDGNGFAKKYKAVPYKSVEDFKQQNPNCCSMEYYSGSASTSWIDYIIGNQSLSVPVVWGKYFYENEGKIYEKKDDRKNYESWPFVPVNNCGKRYNINSIY